MLLLGLIIAGIWAFGFILGHKSGYEYGVKVTEERWSDAVGRAEDARRNNR